MSTVITITTNAAEAAATMRGAPKRMIAGIIKALNRENQYTKGHIESTKLSVRGPKTLGRISSRLVSSVNATKAVQVSDGITSSIGSNVVYAGAHEWGVNKTVQVKAHKRRIIAFDRYRRTARGNFIQTQSGIPGQIRAHSMRMNLPARHMFRNGITERTENYTASVSAAIVAAWQGGTP
jgi:phage gpG-like protein